MPVAVLVMRTVAPLSTAPEGSLAMPTMLPVPIVVCASNGEVRPEPNKAAESATSAGHARIPTSENIR